MAVHDHMILRVHLQPCRMAHHVGRELGGELAPVGEAPEQLGGLAAVGQPHQTQVHVRGVLDVLEIFSGAGDQEILSVQLRASKARGDLPQDLVGVHIVGNLGLAEQQAHIAAVPLVPAVVIHIGGGADHLHHPGSSQNVFHCLFSFTG